MFKMLALSKENW